MARPKKKPEEILKTCSVQLKDKDNQFVKEFAATRQLTFSGAMRIAVHLLRKYSRRRARYEVSKNSKKV